MLTSTYVCTTFSLKYLKSEKTIIKTETPAARVAAQFLCRRGRRIYDPRLPHPPFLPGPPGGWHDTRSSLRFAWDFDRKEFEGYLRMSNLCCVDNFDEIAL